MPFKQKEVKIFRDINTFDKNDCVATLGIFDGVHIGHKYLLNTLVKKSKELNKESLIITFWPHPRLVLQESNQNSIKLLTSIDEKINLIGNCGIDNLLIIPFTLCLSKLSAFDFMCEYLSSKINISHLIIGNNQTIGHDRINSYKTLCEYSSHCNFSVSSTETKLSDDKKISSSAIRQYIINGLIEEANEMLGYKYFINGSVIRGNQIGRKIDFPTANIMVNHPFKLIPQQGVYAVFANINSRVYKGMMNIGTRPTVTSSNEIVIEVHLFDFDDNIYEQNIKIEIIKQVRKEIQFSNITELKNQLKRDKTTIINILTTNIV